MPLPAHLQPRELAGVHIKLKKDLVKLSDIAKLSKSADGKTLTIKSKKAGKADVVYSDPKFVNFVLAQLDKHNVKPT